MTKPIRPDVTPYYSPNNYKDINIFLKKNKINIEDNTPYIIKIYRGCFSWNEENKYHRYKNISIYLSLYLKQSEDDIKDTRNIHNFLTIYTKNNYKLPNKILLKLKRVIRRCWKKHIK